ncbi:hypothetical protein BH09BAC5_BH09BAC5_22960 [soil metagenome]
MADNFSILGLTSTASNEEIKRAYRRLAMKYHPDKNPAPDARQKFIQITKAYDELMSGKRYSSSSVFTAKPKSKPATPPKPGYRTRDDQQREKRIHIQEQMLKKFIEQREANGTGVKFEENKKSAYLEVNFYFVLCGLTLLVGLILPVVSGNVGMLILTFPFALYFAIKCFWTAGRKKMRADMIFSSKTGFSFEELREYFSKDKIGGMGNKYSE